MVITGIISNDVWKSEMIIYYEMVLFIGFDVVLFFEKQICYYKYAKKGYFYSL